MFVHIKGRNRGYAFGNVTVQRWHNFLVTPCNLA